MVTRVEVRGARNGVWGPWVEISQRQSFVSREDAERWVRRRQFVLRLAYRIIPPDRLRIEHRVVDADVEAAS